MRNQEMLFIFVVFRDCAAVPALASQPLRGPLFQFSAAGFEQALDFTGRDEGSPSKPGGADFSLAD